LYREQLSRLADALPGRAGFSLRPYRRSLNCQAASDPAGCLPAGMASSVTDGQGMYALG